MKVYIELFVVDSAVVTSLSACLTYRLVGCKTRPARVFAVTALGTMLSAAYPLLPLPVAAMIALRVVTGLALSALLTVGVCNPPAGTLAFFGATATFAGACVAAGSAAAGLGLSDPSRLPYLLPSCVAAVMYLPAELAAGAIRRRFAERELGVDVCVTIGGRTARMRGYIDTGNGLSECGTPVAVVKMSSFVREFGASALSTHSVGKAAAEGVGGGTRLILIKPDKFLLYFDKKRNKYSDVILGISASGFARNEDMLLPVSVLGG